MTDTQEAAKVIANATNTQSAPQLSVSPIKKRRPSTGTPRSKRGSRRTTPRSRRTTPRRAGLSPVGKQKPKRASDTSFLNRLAAREKKRNQRRPRTAVTCSASGRWSGPGGGRFSMAKPKSDTEWIMKRSRETPGPGQYTPKYVRRNSSCKISDANPKSDVELVMLRSKETPGPSEYKIKYQDASKGLKISDANPKSDLDWVIYRAKQSPAPNAYQNPMKRKQKSGGKFSTAKPLTDTEVLMLRSAESPGPNQYKQDLPSSGRGATKISDANPKVSCARRWVLLLLWVDIAVPDPMALFLLWFFFFPFSFFSFCHLSPNWIG